VQNLDLLGSLPARAARSASAKLALNRSDSSPSLAALDAEGDQLLDRALGTWQRRRAFQYCLVASAFFLLAGAQLLFDLVRQGSITFANWIDIAVTVALCAGYVVAGLLFRRLQPRPALVARLFGWVMVVAGSTGIVGSFMILTYDGELWDDTTSDSIRSFAAAGTALVLVFLVHFVGSLFVALPPWAALWPLLPLWTLYAGGVLLLEGPLWSRAALAALFPLAGGPGLLWSVWCHGRWVSRFTIRLLGGRYEEMRRDLSDARRVHEAIFPPRGDHGPIRLDYAYEPMRDVGGDFLYTRGLAGGELLLVLVDVTGHGIASALAVTRIHAALGLLVEREQGDERGEERTDPQRVMARMNAFVLDQLAPQGIYATAVAVLFDPARARLRWASAGHPPAMLRRSASGSAEILELHATTTMLGVLDGQGFDAQPSEVPFAPGDVLVLCTDGLIEGFDARHEPFGVEGLRAVVKRHQTRTAHAAMEALRAFRVGPAADDTLVVEVRFSAAL